MARVVKSQVKSGINEDALIWAKVKEVLNRKGADAAIEALKEIRKQQDPDQGFALARIIRLA